MKHTENNYAFIDGQNLYLALRNVGWQLDYKKFRIYLKEKYNVTKAFMFIGFVPTNNELYTALQSEGFLLIFRPTLTYKDGTIKGNCDAELVLNAMIEYKNYDKAVVVTGDGDFQCLVKYFNEQNKLKTLLVPNMNRYSALLKSAAEEKIAFINPLKAKLEGKKRVLKTEEPIAPAPVPVEVPKVQKPARTAERPRRQRRSLRGRRGGAKKSDIVE